MDRGKMAALLPAHLPVLTSYAKSLRRRNSFLFARGDAGDLVQKVCVRALTRAHLFQEGTNLKSWLLTLAHNLHVSEVRARLRDLQQWDPANNEPSSPRVAEPEALARLAVRDVMRVLSKMPEEKRQIVLLVCVEEFSYDAAAAVLDVPVGTIRSRLARAREELKDTCR